MIFVLRPQRRCSKSLKPFYFSAKKTLIFLGEFLKSASSPCPVNRAMCRHRLVFRDVPKTQEKPMHFAWFLCLGRTVRTTKSRIPKSTSGHLGRSIFFWCPEVGLEFLF